MAKTSKRKPAAPKPIDPRLAQRRAERRELSRYRAEVVRVTKLTRQLRRAIQTADHDLLEFVSWLRHRIDRLQELENAPTGTEG